MPGAVLASCWPRNLRTRRASSGSRARITGGRHITARDTMAPFTNVDARSAYVAALGLRAAAQAGEDCERAPRPVEIGGRLPGMSRSPRTFSARRFGSFNCGRHRKLTSTPSVALASAARKHPTLRGARLTQEAVSAAGALWSALRQNVESVTSRRWWGSPSRSSSRHATDGS